MKAVIITLSLLAVSIQMAAPELALSAQGPNLAGTFRLVAEQSDDIGGAIENAIAPMNFVYRSFARSRLRVINPLSPSLTIESTSDQMTIVADPRVPVRTPLNGKPIRWQRADGEPFNVTGTWEGSVFEQTFVSGTGHRVNRYSLSPDSQMLTMGVEITGGGLPGRMTYRLVYRRVSEQALLSR